MNEWSKERFFFYVEKFNLVDKVEEVYYVEII
jgi:hypothetical protein